MRELFMEKNVFILAVFIDYVDASDCFKQEESI